MIRYLRGYAIVRITGAAPERCLNRFAAAGVAFWAPEKLDALQMRCCIYQKDLQRADRCATRAMCTLQIERLRGLRNYLGGLKRRPVLLLGMLAAVLLTLLAQNFVWVVRIEGNETLTQAQILHALTEEGIGFGTLGRDIDSLMLRYRMQLRLPQLRWLAANCSGGVLTVLVAERKSGEAEPVVTGIANLCASRDGIITRVIAENGSAVVAPGDAVRQGELLISGITGWETRMQLTHAKGEVYALTTRDYHAVIPCQVLQKQYTGKCERQVTLIVGRKRIKIFGNSRISTTECDKMVSRRPLTLPSGDTLPLALEIVTYRYYESVPCLLSEAEAGGILERFVLQNAERQMVAGTVQHAEQHLTKENGCWLLEAELTCEEEISVTVPVRRLGEDEIVGEVDQRRTD